MQNIKPDSHAEADCFRQHHIDFDLYTDGDEEFRRELGPLVIKNLAELRDALLSSVNANDPDIFDRTCHKAKLTLAMLNDAEFTSTIASVSEGLRQPADTAHFRDHCAAFVKMCNGLIASLSLEFQRTHESKAA